MGWREGGWCAWSQGSPVALIYPQPGSPGRAGLVGPQGGWVWGWVWGSQSRRPQRFRWLGEVQKQQGPPGLPRGPLWPGHSGPLLPACQSLLPFLIISLLPATCLIFWPNWTGPLGQAVSWLKQVFLVSCQNLTLYSRPSSWSLSKSFQNQLSALFQLWQWPWSIFAGSLSAFGIPLSPRGTRGRSQLRPVGSWVRSALTVLLRSTCAVDDTSRGVTEADRYDLGRHFLLWLLWSSGWKALLSGPEYHSPYGFNLWLSRAEGGIITGAFWLRTWSSCSGGVSSVSLVSTLASSSSWGGLISAPCWLPFIPRSADARNP